MALYILDSCFVLGFLYGGWFIGQRCPCGQFDIGWLDFAQLPDIEISQCRVGSLRSPLMYPCFFLGWFIGALFFGLNLLGVFLLWADWVGYHFVGFTNMVNAEFFFARGRYL